MDYNMAQFTEGPLLALTRQSMHPSALLSREVAKDFKRIRPIADQRRLFSSSIEDVPVFFLSRGSSIQVLKCVADDKIDSLLQ